MWFEFRMYSRFVEKYLSQAQKENSSQKIFLLWQYTANSYKTNSALNKAHTKIGESKNLKSDLVLKHFEWSS